jgi:hypothetical protein
VSATATLQGLTAAQMSAQATQTAFKNTVASTAGVSVDYINIISIVDVVAGRHLLAVSCLVSFTVATVTASTASVVSAAITAASGSAAFVTALNAQLAAQGAGVAVTGATTTATIVTTPSSNSASGGGRSLPTIIGWVVAVMIQLMY